MTTDLARSGIGQPSPRGRRRAGPAGLRRAGRLRELLVSGVIDSFGMALGWTVLVLFAVSRGGLAEAALYNAAMLIGVVLSAPVTGWLSRRIHGRGLLRGAVGVELLLRVGLLTGLLFGLPAWLIATGIAVMHIAAWAGFAAMRAEVNAVDASPRAMTRYALSIAAVEAVGTGLAALLPSGPDGYPTGLPLVLIFIVYAGSLIPTFRAARRSRTTPWGPARPGRPATPRGYGETRAALRPFRTPGPNGRPRLAVSPKVLAAGGAIMLLASGPTLLAVPLTTELHGRTWVAGVAVAFSLGCLLSTMAVELIGRMRVPAALRWSLWGLGMLVGWIYAPLHAIIILLAQFLAGLSQTAFEGDMDARVAENAPPEAVTTALAYSASTRALGGAIAVKLLPMMVTAQAVGAVASGAMLILGVSALAIWAATSIPGLIGPAAAPRAT